MASARENILHAEVVDTEGERGALHAMAPEAWGERHGSISGRFQFLDELAKARTPASLRPYMSWRISR